jgi:hypothetical protein
MVCCATVSVKRHESHVSALPTTVMVRASLILSCNLLLFISELTRIVIQIDDALKVRKYRYAWFSENAPTGPSFTSIDQ